MESADLTSDQSGGAGELAPVGDRDHVLGAAEPKLTLIEYGDFGCPFCFAANRPVMSLLERYDTMRLVWRHFPDSDLHPGADLAAEVSEVAAQQGLFWEAHSLLLAGRERFSLQDLRSVASELGLEGADAALRDRSYKDRVDDDVAAGKSAGVHGTPTFFLNEERLEGHWRQLADLIPAMLEGDSTPAASERRS